MLQPSRTGTERARSCPARRGRPGWLPRLQSVEHVCGVRGDVVAAAEPEARARPALGQAVEQVLERGLRKVWGKARCSASLCSRACSAANPASASSAASRPAL